MTLLLSSTLHNSNICTMRKINMNYIQTLKLLLGGCVFAQLAVLFDGFVRFRLYFGGPPLYIYKIEHIQYMWCANLGCNPG